MSLVRIYPAGWGVGEMLTSAQMNDLDINVTNAADKQAGTDNIACTWTLTGAGRIVQAPYTGLNVDTSYVATDVVRSIRVMTGVVTADREYTLDDTGAVAGDRIMIWCDPDFTFAITVKNHDGTIISELGFKNTSDAGWSEFMFDGTDWVVFQGPTARLHEATYTADDTFVVPRNITKMIIEHVGGGGGGGGGRGNATSGGDQSAPAGGGSRRRRVVVDVVPGETLTIVVGAGGTAGTGGNSAGGAGTAGGHGTDGTVAGSTSGLLSTARGAQGAIFATNSAGFYMGGFPVKWNTVTAGYDYPNNSGSPLTTAGGSYPYYPIPGQGGFAGTIAKPGAKCGGATQYAQGGFVSQVDSTYAGSGGASEWEGGNGGDSGGAVNAFVSGGNGTAGVLGGGGGGGAGGWTGIAGGDGGAGGDGACKLGWIR